MRDLFRFHGATTGRWSGAGFQPQNLKRPELLKTDEAIAAAITMVLAGDYAALKERYGDVLGVIGDLCRSMIIPAPGHRFIVGDFSAIEARVLAFLAGDADKLEAFRQFDLGLGRDIYCVTAEQVLGLAGLHDKSPERQLGKIFELGLGYQMGADRLLATIRKANVPSTAAITIEDAARWVRTWRARNPRIVAYWAQLECNGDGGGAQSRNVFPLPQRLLPDVRQRAFAAPAVRARAELPGAGDRAGALRQTAS